MAGINTNYSIGFSGLRVMSPSNFPTFRLAEVFHHLELEFDKNRAAMNLHDQAPSVGYVSGRLINKIDETAERYPNAPATKLLKRISNQVKASAKQSGRTEGFLSENDPVLQETEGLVIEELGTDWAEKLHKWVSKRKG